MENQTEVLPLRIIAARCISRDEQEGLATLNRITEAVYSAVKWRYAFLWGLFTMALFACVVTIIPGIALSLTGNKIGEIVMTVGMVPFVLLCAVLSYWRISQYGSMKASTPQKGIYADPDDPAVQNLERLFAVLQRETPRRAFYLQRNGVRRDIDERYFFGSLRAVCVAKDMSIKEPMFAPTGFWFTRELFMEVNVNELIAEAKAKPNQPGPKKTYDYTDAVMSLIEHPFIRSLEIGKRGNITKIRDMLEASFIAHRQPAPGKERLETHAKVILEVIRKNRQAKI